MKISNCRRSLIVVLAVTGLTSTVYSQKEKDARKGTVADASVSHLDQHFVDCLIEDSQATVAAAKLAAEHSSNQDVREFAKMLDDDQHKFISDLEMFASPSFRNRMDQRKLAKTNSAADTPEKVRIDVPAQPGRPLMPQPSSAAEAYGRLLQIREEYAAEWQSSIQHELEGKKGEAFDDAFIGLQIATQIQMVDLLKVLEKHVSPILQPVLKKGREAAQSRLDRAKAIMQDLAHAQTTHPKTTTEE